MMQSAGYLLFNNEKIKVLFRVYKTYVAVKYRKTGKEGQYLSEESRDLTSEIINKIKQGIVYKF